MNSDAQENGLDVAFVAANRGHNETSRIGPFLKHPLMHIGQFSVMRRALGKPHVM